jgi:D-alanyl-D-alanine dipeptidase
MCKQGYTIFSLIVLLISCDTKVKNNTKSSIPEAKNNIINSIKKDTVTPIKETIISEIEAKLIKHGLVDIQTVDSTLNIDVRYSTVNNFVGIDLYGDLNKVFLQPDVAKKLRVAQQLLKEKDSTLSLLIFDGVRPLSIQQLMWDTLKLPIHEKTKFLSNPKNHSIHNYGAAIDLTICNYLNTELNMGTPYDYIGKEAYPRMENYFLETGYLTKENIENRKLLREIMKKSGFTSISSEWWHFNSCSRNEAKEKYKIVE